MLRTSLEKSLIEHCSPVLAGLKAANLVNYSSRELDEVEEFLETKGKELQEKGISLTVLRKRGQNILLYVYRREKLESLLCREEIQAFLENCGYGEMGIDACLEKLKARLEKNEEFPHEIGIFLDYPLGDVKGFIENQGKNCKCVGCWKVYCDECEARKRFEMYERCRQFFMVRFLAGSNIVQLAAG